VERVAFEREPWGQTRRGGVLVAAAALDWDAWAGSDPTAPHLVFDWRPGGSADSIGDAVERLRARVTGLVEVAVCPHPAGPPSCWCRPPLPGLALAFARRHDLD